ncbi:MFS transporter [Vibrio cholerae]
MKMTSRLLWIFSVTKAASVIMLLIIPLALAKQLSSEEYSIIKSVEYLPSVFMGLLIGFLLDSYSSDRLLYASIITQSLSNLSLYILLLNGLDGTILNVIVFLLSFSGFITWSAINKLAKQQIAQSEVMNFNSNLTTIYNVSDTLFPVCIGALFYFFNIHIIVLLVFVPLASLPSVRTIAQNESLKNVNEPLFAGMKNAIVKTISNKYVLYLSLVVMIINAVELVPGTMMAYYAINALDIDSFGLSYLLASASIGGIAGGIVSKYLPSNEKNLILYMLFSILVNAFCYFLVWKYQSAFMLCAVLFVENLSIVISAIAFRTLRHNFSDQQFYGVTLGVSGAIVKFLTPLSIFLTARFSNQFSLDYIYMFAFIGELLLALPAIFIFYLFAVKKRVSFAQQQSG